jgi:hypothetical protein
LRSGDARAAGGCTGYIAEHVGGVHGGGDGRNVERTSRVRGGLFYVDLKGSWFWWLKNKVFPHLKYRVGVAIKV